MALKWAACAWKMRTARRPQSLLARRGAVANLRAFGGGRGVRQKISQLTPDDAMTNGCNPIADSNGAAPNRPPPTLPRADRFWERLQHRTQIVAERFFDEVAACSSSCTRLSADGSTRRGAWRCESDSARRSISNCRLPQPTKALSSPWASVTAFRWTRSSDTSIPTHSGTSWFSPYCRRRCLRRAGGGTPHVRWRSCALPAARRYRRRFSGCVLRICLGAVFPRHGLPGQSSRRDVVDPPDHPLIKETLRDCLTEAMDIDGLACVLERIASGEIRCIAIDTPAPSAFCHEILNANPYAYLDDAPLEERRARAVEMRRTLAAGNGGTNRRARSRGDRRSDAAKPGPSCATRTNCTMPC